MWAPMLLYLRRRTSVQDDREPIFHDRQSIDVVGPITIGAGGSFVNIPGATLTTKDLAQTSDYIVTAVAEIEHTNNNSLIELRIMVNGVAELDKDFFFGPNSAGNPKTIVTVGEAPSVEVGAIVQIQWRTDRDDAVLNDLSIVIDGIPTARLVTS